MSTSVDKRKVACVNMVVAQDVAFGFGIVEQIRNGIKVLGSKINANSVPYSDDATVKDSLDTLISAVEDLTARIEVLEAE